MAARWVFDRAANSRIRDAMIELLPWIIDLAQVATFERWSQEVRGIADRLDQDGGYDPADDPTNNHLHLVPTTGGITYIHGQLVGELALTIKKLIDAEIEQVLTRYPHRRRNLRRRHPPFPHGHRPQPKHLPNCWTAAQACPTQPANSPNPKLLSS
jgi:hypothetical protein